MSDVTATTITWQCAHCGRPIGGAAVWLGQGAYHVECTQSPYAAPPAPMSDREKQLVEAARELLDWFKMERNNADIGKLKRALAKYD